jgi:hypothetical protein
MQTDIVIQGIGQVGTERRVGELILYQLRLGSEGEAVKIIPVPYRM